MKEHVNEPGVRDWYGDDLCELQSELLEAMQGFFSEFGAHIVQGCAISANGSNWDIAAGIAAIEHADGFKLVRVAAQTNVALPCYFRAVKTTQTGAYGTGTDSISHTYAAQFQAGAAPTGTPTELEIPDPAVGEPMRFPEAFGGAAVTGWANFSKTETDFTSSIDMRVDMASKTLHIKGGMSITGYSGWSQVVEVLTLVDAVDMLADATIGPYLTTMGTFSGNLTGLIDTIFPGTFPKDNAGVFFLQQMNGYVTNTGGLFVNAIEGNGNYDITFSAVIPLD